VPLPLEWVAGIIIAAVILAGGALWFLRKRKTK
jgi:LPXTG-motif cell wall-anchored protein